MLCVKISVNMPNCFPCPAHMHLSNMTVGPSKLPNRPRWLCTSFGQAWIYQLLAGTVLQVDLDALQDEQHIQHLSMGHMPISVGIASMYPKLIWMPLIMTSK